LILDEERNVQSTKYFKRKIVSYFYEPTIQRAIMMILMYFYIF
jgi:hypothetical protein